MRNLPELLQRVFLGGETRRRDGADEFGALEPPTREEAAAIALYLASDRVPFFSPGYSEYKEHQVLEAYAHPVIRRAFLEGRPLPAEYGARLDERIVEYPWVFSRLPHDGLILDAGSTFNKAKFLRSPVLRDRRLLIYTLETDWITLDPNVSYIFGDLRSMIVKDACASAVVCISTLEHVGFTYEYSTYSRRNPWPYAEPDSYLDAVREFRRVIKPGGRLLLTVPYGRYEDHGWLQQFDASMIEEVRQTFGGVTVAEQYYRYAENVWRLAAKEECADVSYFNIHETGRFEEDGLAAARAVCCLALEKSDG